jgi:hypothetical protein
VALFFLLTAAIDIAHPCAEKLEAVGLLPDHFNPSRSDSDDRRDPDSNSDIGREAVPGAGEPEGDPSDDDCFCCNGRALIGQSTNQFGPFAGDPLLTAGTSAIGLAGLLGPDELHPPPLFECLLTFLHQRSELPNRRPEEVLAAGLLSPPDCTA